LRDYKVSAELGEASGIGESPMRAAVFPEIQKIEPPIAAITREVDFKGVVAKEQKPISGTTSQKR
jgi:hypothetical protein